MLIWRCAVAEKLNRSEQMKNLETGSDQAMNGFVIACSNPFSGAQQLEVDHLADCSMCWRTYALERDPNSGSCFTSGGTLTHALSNQGLSVEVRKCPPSKIIVIDDLLF